MSGSYRASVGHNPKILVKKAGLSLSGGPVSFSTGGPPIGEYNFPSGSTPTTGTALTAVPTFHNIGLYWSEPSGSTSNTALVRFRPASGIWRQGYTLWYDARLQDNNGQMSNGVSGAVVNKVPYGNQQYRGSLVGLQPGTTYEIEVMTQSGTRKLSSTTCTTWTETWHVASTINVGSRSSTLNITSGGSPGNYVLYTAGTINTTSPYCINISAPYVIIRGLTLVGGMDGGASVGSSGSIRIQSGAHDIVIEDCDMSQMGTNGWKCYGIGTDSGTYIGGVLSNGSITKVVIQNNRIHHPKYDTIRWPTGHPQGVLGTFLRNTGGNHVIRYNSIYSDLTGNFFEDGISGGENFSAYGALHKDSDVYGNSITHIADDGIEADGGLCNCRIYNNKITYAFVDISTSATAIGPCYIFRNVAHNPYKNSTESTTGNWYKTLGKSVPDAVNSSLYCGGGRVYMFHNTLYHNSGTDNIKGMFTTREMGLINMVSRNNIFHVRDSNLSLEAQKYTVYYGPDPPGVGGLDFDYDYYVGAGMTTYGNEPNGKAIGVGTTPVYDAGTYQLTNTSPGRDAATYLPNFNDQFTTPDVGAQERGQPAIVFGVR